MGEDREGELNCCLGNIPWSQVDSTGQSWDSSRV